MITKKHLKIFLILLSLAVLLLGGCKVRNKLGSVTQDSQISGGGNSGESVSNGLNTSLPIWNVKYFPIPEEYWGKYQYLKGDVGYQGIATVTSKDITLYYEDYDGNLRVLKYFHVFDKNAEYLEDNTWWYWNSNYDSDNYINKYKNDFRLSMSPPDIIRFERNEKGQRVLLKHYNEIYIHEDDINK